MDNNEDDLVTIHVVSELDLTHTAQEAEENAWEHAKESAIVNDYDLGGDEFQAIYKVLLERYQHNTEHLNFFMTAALLTLRAMFETKVIKLVPQYEDGLYEEEIADKMQILAEKLVNSYLWLTAGYEITWLHNDELPNEVVVAFKFDSKELQD